MRFIHIAGSIRHFSWAIFDPYSFLKKFTWKDFIIFDPCHFSKNHFLSYLHLGLIKLDLY